MNITISRVFSTIRAETTDDDVVGITFEIEDSASVSDTADEVPELVCPMLFFCKYLSLVVNK